jgi:hypothetical protein
MSAKRELPKDRVRIPHLFSKGDMLSTVRQLIKKKKARGYGEKAFKSAKMGLSEKRAKDISKPEARKVFDYLLQRRIFDNGLMKRKDLEGLLLSTYFLDRNQVKDFLRDRLWVVMKERKVKDRVQFLENFRLILEKVNLRVEHIITQVAEIKYAGKSPKNKKEATQKYIRDNTKDHMGQRLSLYVHLVDSTRVAEEVVAELKKEV